MNRSIKLSLIALTMAFAYSVKHENSSIVQNASNEKADKQFKAILLNPEKFDSTEVELTGIFRYEFENIAIYLTSNDSDSLISSNAFWVNGYGTSDSLLFKKFKKSELQKSSFKGSI